MSEPVQKKQTYTAAEYNGALQELSAQYVDQIGALMDQRNNAQNELAAKQMEVGQWRRRAEQFEKLAQAKDVENAALRSHIDELESCPPETDEEDLPPKEEA